LGLIYMANIMLGFPNLIDLGNLSGGSWTAGLPLTNIQFRQLKRVARSADAAEASAQFRIDFLQQRAVRVVALVNHNISFGGRIVIEAANDGDFDTILYTANVDAWAALAGAEWELDELEWEADNFWLGTITLDELEGLTPLAVHILPNEVSARFWRVRIVDTGNGAGYIDVGRVFIGPAWQPRINYSFGSSLGYEDPTTVQTSLGGAEFFDERDPYRVMRFTLGFLDEATEGFAKVLEAQRQAGISGEVLTIPDPDDADNGARRNFLGRHLELDKLEQVFHETASNGFEIKELK
jgi:hypothetical protein